MDKKTLNIIHCVSAQLIFVAAILRILHIISSGFFWLIFAIVSLFTLIYQNFVIDKLNKQLKDKNNLIS